MSPVLKNADVVLVNRIVYNASSPKSGRYYRVQAEEAMRSSHYYTKRIVGLPGETVTDHGEQIYINGLKLKKIMKLLQSDTAGIASEKITWR